jgi:hypothetical protein
LTHGYPLNAAARSYTTKLFCHNNIITNFTYILIFVIMAGPLPSQVEYFSTSNSISLQKSKIGPKHASLFGKRVNYGKIGFIA